MKENYFAFKEMTDNQRKILIDTIQLYDAYVDAYRDSRSYRGGMHWKKAKGRQYLFRSMDRYGNGKSLGPRSEETEKVYTQFKQNKTEVKERLTSLEMRLKEQARFCRAASIQRVPRIAASILRVLDQHKLLGRNVIVIGTHAIYAYEAAAGVILDTTLLSTSDIDILWDVRSRLNLAVYDDTAKETGLVELLQKADRLFKKVDRKRLKKKRDRHQSFAVALLVIMHMPQYKFNPADLKMFPKRLVDEAMAEISNLDLPPGFQ